jgi:hypothetical protein
MGAGTSFHTRDVLDKAVRYLALSTAPMLDRVVAAGAILTGDLKRSNFPDREDRELFERIELTLTALHDDDARNDVSAATIDATAADILDLRDTIMGRAILGASRAEPAPEPHIAHPQSRWFFTDW